MPINASLFGHIQNDAFLTGTYKLEAHLLSDTSAYLKNYLEQLEKSEAPLNSKYVQLLKDMNYLVTLENRVQSTVAPDRLNAHVERLAADIHKDLRELSPGQRLLIPGGWLDENGGHSMLYEFIRHETGYYFIIYNSGDGITYHEKKSTTEKELYNPTKTWNIPFARTKERPAELKLFLERLLKARLKTTEVQTSMTAKKLYHELLPSIIYAGGEENNLTINPSAYTAGQFSGTCSQRVLHQMLKINALSLEQYQNFIFKFKLYALKDYCEQCCSGLQPFSSAVAEQIYLAIENNFKILAIRELFDDKEETAKYFAELKDLKRRIQALPLSNKLPTKHVETYPHHWLCEEKLAVVNINYSEYNYTPPPTINIKFSDSNLLIQLAEATLAISQIDNPTQQYLHLEQLLLALPLSTNSEFTNSPYTRILSIDEFERFYQQIEQVQILLHSLQKNWLKEAELSKLNVLMLSALSLYTDIQNVLAAKNKRPSFQALTNQTLQTIISNQKRNPFWATNHPKLDERFLALQRKYAQQNVLFDKDFYAYFRELLNTEPLLNEELTHLFTKNFGSNIAELFNKIRQHQLESLYMVSLHLDRKITLDARFNPLIEKIKAHIAYEGKLRAHINHFFITKYKETPYLTPEIIFNAFRVSTPLYPTFVPYEKLSQQLSQQQKTSTSPAVKQALMADVPQTSAYNKAIVARTANHIQLYPESAQEHPYSRIITREDILARDYFHLRSVPGLQITLTLDYFKRNIDQLADHSNRFYLEANLLQPGLLLEAMKETAFFTQFDNVLNIGLRYFTQHGQHTSESLFLLKLNFLLSHYQALTGETEGVTRLEKIQQDLQKQLATQNDPDLIYALNYYLFLTTTAKRQGRAYSKEDFELVLSAYIHIQSHTKSTAIEESNADKNTFDCAVANFQNCLYQHCQSNELALAATAKKILELNNQYWNNFSLTGHFPVYNLVKTSGQTLYKFNLILGKLFENNLSHSGLPLNLKNHPLLRHLQLNNPQQCSSSADECYFYLIQDKKRAKIYHQNNKLTVQQYWTSDHVEQLYELQALTPNHLALEANQSINHIINDLPRILLDTGSDYWRSLSTPITGLLVQNNKARYKITDAIYLLDEQENSTPFILKPLKNPWAALLTRFESSQFLLHHQSSDAAYVDLPRFNLRFSLSHNNLTLEETKENILNCASPIHPSIAGLVLKKDTQQRMLVPIAPFYASTTGAEASGFYPLIHDINTTIAQNHIEKNLSHLQKKPLWSYKNSGNYVSFRLKDGEAVADNAADALYLAYLYLASNQTQKAWNVLEDCRTRLGGLTGSADELKYCLWICNELPHILTGNDKETQKARRKTPPYIACKLKALSLLCDALSQELPFKIPNPTSEPSTANYHWEKKQQDDQVNFLSSLPIIIYSDFTRLQAMRRHLEESYTLSAIERKRLLTYYQQSQNSSDAPKGTLGYEWMLLNIETLVQERLTLLALKNINSLSEADSLRLNQIETHLTHLKPVISISSTLKLNPIDLNLPGLCEIKQAHLSKATSSTLNDWINNLPGTTASEGLLNKAMNALSSSLSEDKLVVYFPVYLQIMLGSNPDRKKLLADFCQSTLIAERHIPLDKQTKNRALFSNILHRVVTNNEKINQLKTPFTFQQLTLETKKITPYALPVYEIVDEYKNILSTPAEILKRIPQQSALSPSALKSSYIPFVNTMTQSTKFTPFINQYSDLNKSYEKASEALTKQIDSNAEHLILSEEVAGKNQLHFELQQIALAQKLINEPQAWFQLQELVKALIPQAHSRYLELERKALKLANEGPDDPKKMRLWQMEQAAKKRITLSKADLYSLYTKADLHFTCAKTGLNLKKAQELHELIHDSLVHGVQYQSICKTDKAIQKTKLSHEPQDLIPGLDFIIKNAIPGLDSPSLVLLQHAEEIILRPRQISALKTLLQDNKVGNESVEKIIPGGGKSKVILPLVAEQKAQGTNLVIVEVPQALLATNHVDLNRTSQRLFGKTAYRFEFNRDSNCSAKRLEELYNKFIEVMTSRSYLVTAGESMQSIELTYLELLLKEEPYDQEWEKQVYWCDCLVNLIRHHGHVVIDEVHQGLWIKKKLNYTLGDPKPAHQNTVINSIALFQFIDPGFIKAAPSLKENYDWKPFQHDLARKLLSAESSPLYSFVRFSERKYGATALKELFDYLTNSIEPPALIDKAPSDIKASLAFFKQQINTLLPATLVRHLNTNYGASKKPRLSAIEQTLAIPYEANNIANERSRFSNTLEAMNYACQMLFIQGVSKPLLKEYLIQLQAIALQELFKNNELKHLDDTPTAQGIALLWPDLGLSLSKIKLNDEEQINNLYERLRNNKALTLDILQQQTLKRIPNEGSFIHSDSFNHVDLYHTVQAVSGTPSNHTTYHQRLAFDNTASLGTDGYIIELLKHKKTIINAQNYKTLPQFIKTILENSQSPAHCRAIIDIRAAFQGIPNLTVAQELATYIRDHQLQFNTSLKHVLYFNEQQILCAIDVSKPNSPIVLKTTDVNEINLILGSTPNERFTYYDQARALGTDLVQDEHAHALVLVDEKTSLQSFLQGSMRMRGLGQKQSVELIIPEHLRGIALPELIKKFSKTDSQTLLMDNLFAAKGQMANLIRRHCLSRIQNLPSESATAKATMTKAFKAFFIQNPSNDLFELYGALSPKKPASKILAHFKTQLLNSFTRAYAKAGLAPETDQNNLSSKLDKLIERALIHCLSEYDSSSNDLAVEVETQKEVLTATQLQVAAINEFFDPSLEESKLINWKNYSLSSLFSTPSNLNKTSQPINSLSTPLNLFSEQLRVSRNYIQTHSKQKTYLDAFLKPVSLIWYHMEGDVLHAMLLTPQECEQLKNHIEKMPSNWIATIEDTLVCGKQPPAIHTSKQYQLLRDQARFFNGEFDSFLNPEVQSEWFNEQVSQKLDFFEQCILPFRPRSENKFQEFKSIMTQANMEGFAYIADHPYEDLSLFDWNSLFPETTVAQAADYKKMADAFVEIYATWQTNLSTLANLQQKYRLPLKSLAYVNNHLQQLGKLSTLLDVLKRNSINLGARLIPNHERQSLEHYLNQPFDEIYKHYSTNTCAYIDLLEQIYTHPAIANKEGLSSALQRIARLNSSEDVFYKLLESKNLNHELLTSILYAPIRHSQLTDKLLSLPIGLFSNELLSPLIERCENEQQIQALINKKSLPLKAVHLLLNKNLKDNQILELLLQINDSKILEEIYHNFRTSKAVRQAIYAHPILTASCLLEIAKDSPCFAEDELISLLTNPKTPVDTQVLSAIVINTIYKAPILLAVAKHPQANAQTIKQILNHIQCTPQLMLQILETKGPMLGLDTYKAIAKKAYSYTVFTNPHREEWENCLLHCLKSIYTFKSKRNLGSFQESSQCLVFIYSLVNSFDLPEYPKFALKLLQLLKHNISYKLPFGSMITNANPEELKILVDYQFTGPLLNNHLKQLYERCTSPELIDLFIQRPDLNAAQSLKLLSKTNLSEAQLQTLITNNHHETVLKTAFIHPNATETVKKSIYTHPYFSNKIFNIQKSRVSPKHLHYILSHCQEFTAFTSALHHPQLSTQEREQWFHEALLQQTKLENKATKTQKPQDKLLASLEKLKIKTFTHALKAKTEPRYTDCTKAAFELQRKLSAHAELIMMKRAPIIREMLNTINEASPTLATHRGYKQIILDILNLILTTLSFGLTSKNGDWRLFKAKTDSLVLIEEVKNCIEQFNPTQQMAFELN